MEKRENVCPGCGAYMKSNDSGILVCEYCGTQVIYNHKKKEEHPKDFKKSNTERLQKTKTHKRFSVLDAGKSLYFLMGIYFVTIALSLVNYLITLSLNIENPIAITILVGLFIIIILFILTLNFPALILLLIANRRIHSRDSSEGNKRINKLTRILALIYMFASILDAILLIVLIII